VREISKLLDELKALETDEARLKWRTALSPEEEMLLMMEAREFIDTFYTNIFPIIRQIWNSIKSVYDTLAEAGILDVVEEGNYE